MCVRIAALSKQGYQPPLMDIIFIQDLRVDAIIGIYEWERTTRQTIAVDLEMGTDIRPAAAGDDIEKTASYKDVAKRLSDFIEHSEFLLVETLAEEIASIVLGEFPVFWVRVTVHKPGAVSVARDVGIIIERGEKR